MAAGEPAREVRPGLGKGGVGGLRILLAAMPMPMPGLIRGVEPPRQGTSPLCAKFHKTSVPNFLPRCFSFGKKRSPVSGSKG